MAIAADIGRYPLIIRPAFTCGGAGGGIAYNVDEFKRIVQEGIDASMTNQARRSHIFVLESSDHLLVTCQWLLCEGPCGDLSHWLEGV